jgi:hypothetical protein
VTVLRRLSVWSSSHPRSSSLASPLPAPTPRRGWPDGRPTGWRLLRTGIRRCALQVARPGVRPKRAWGRDAAKKPEGVEATLERSRGRALLFVSGFPHTFPAPLRLPLIWKVLPTSKKRPRPFFFWGQCFPHLIRWRFKVEQPPAQARDCVREPARGDEGTVE